jgi:hemerythrin-like domain-containing protein
MHSEKGRRSFIAMTALAGIAAAGASPVAFADSEKPVTATEDLMREHGVLRRALLVYRACATRLREKRASVPTNALYRTAQLFRNFGEDYHELKLEEQYIFPAVKKLSSDAAHYPDILTGQHNLGRQLTDYVLAVSRSGSIGETHATTLSRALSQFELMYEHHTAREDTIVFTAWKDSLSQSDYREIGEKFEDIEKQTFGHDGFDDAVRQISEIETAFGLTDIARFDMSRPPSV